jgi:hypothetical protein
MFRFQLIETVYNLHSIKIIMCALCGNPQKIVEISESSSVLILKILSCNIVHFLVYS